MADNQRLEQQPQSSSLLSPHWELFKDIMSVRKPRGPAPKVRKSYPEYTPQTEPFLLNPDGSVHAYQMAPYPEIDYSEGDKAVPPRDKREKDPYVPRTPKEGKEDPWV